jgi:hypothetical protein
MVQQIGCVDEEDGMAELEAMIGDGCRQMCLAAAVATL